MVAARLGTYLGREQVLAPQDQSEADPREGDEQQPTLELHLAAERVEDQQPEAGGDGHQQQACHQPRDAALVAHDRSPMNRITITTEPSPMTSPTKPSTTGPPRLRA